MYAERLPPHDVDAEESLIGSLLIDDQAILKVAPFLKPEDFYREKNRRCYEACVELFQRGEAVNQVTVAHELVRVERLEEVGGASYLSHLVYTVPTSAHVEHYARLVSRTALMRRLIRAAGEVAALGYEGPADPDEALSKAEDILFRLRSGRDRRDFVPLRDVLDQYLEESATLLGPLERGQAPVPTGYVDMDRLLGGLQRSDLVVLAGRPGFGKSTLALNMGRYAAGRGATVGVFSLEMSREQLAIRLLSAEAGVDSHRIRLRLHTEAEDHRIMDAIGTLSELPIYIDDSPLQNIVEIRSKARRLHQEKRVDLLIVDYLQLMQGNSRSENRVQEISEITRSLKGLARDLNAPLIAVSQLSRAGEIRPSHRPQLSDLRESGSIEQDADVVLFIYREDAYITEDVWDQRFPDKQYPKGLVELIVAKHRHGPTGTVDLFFREMASRFENLLSQGGS